MSQRHVMDPVPAMAAGLLVCGVVAAVLAQTPDPAASFADFDRRAKAGERLNVVFFGASLTWGANASDPNRTSYRGLVSQRLEQRYPEARFKFFDAAIGGTGSQLGIFRLERDVLAHRPDLVFVDFTANDTITTADPVTLAAYEAIVRRIIAEARAPVVQVIFPFQWDLKTPMNGLPRREAHLAIGRAYGTACGDAVELLKQRVSEGRVRTEDLWPIDPVHPGDAGYVHFADAAWSAFEQAVAEGRDCLLPTEPLHGDLFLTTQRVRLAEQAGLPEGWVPGKPSVQSSNHDMLMSRWLDSVVTVRAPADATAEAPADGPRLRLRFRGRFIMLFGEATPKTGKFRAWIDGQPVTFRAKKQPQTLFDPGYLGKRIGSTTHLVTVITSEAEGSADHVLEIEPLFDTPDEELRVESVCVAGPGAQVQLLQP